jgi:hypothetical protein
MGQTLVGVEAKPQAKFLLSVLKRRITIACFISGLHDAQLTWLTPIHVEMLLLLLKVLVCTQGATL